MSVKQVITENVPFLSSDEDDESGRVDIDKISNDEMERVLDHCDALGKEKTRENIEKVAYHLRSIDEDVELFSAFESGEERGRIDKAVVSPTNMERDTKWHTRDGEFYQILTTTNLPRLVTPGWLIGLTLSEHDIRISRHVKPRDTSTVKGKLQQRLTQMKSAIQWKKKRGRTDVFEEEHEQKELTRLLRSVIEGTTKLYDFSFYIEVHGNTLEEMEEASRIIQRKASEQGMDLIPVEGRQIDSQQAMQPVGTDPIRNNNTIQLEALGTFFNFVEPPVYQPGGVLFGFDNSKRPVIVDRFELSGHSKAVTGKVGGGKSYSTKMTLYRRLLNDDDVRIIIFDPLGDDFVDFTEKLDGQVIRFGGGDRVNPLQIEKPTGEEDTEDLYTTKVRSVLEILKTYFEQSGRQGMDGGEEGVITLAIHYAYAKKGITHDPETFGNESPILDDVIEGIRIIAQGGISEDSAPATEAIADGAGTLDHCPSRTKEIIQDPSDQHTQIAKELVPKFESFKSGSINSNLNGETNIELNDRIVCFDMESFSDGGEMPLIMHTMLDWAYHVARRSPRRLDITFEEAHYLLNKKGSRKLLNLFFRHARHFDAGLTLITQTPDEFLENEEKKEIYDQCDIKQMFYQENVSEKVIKYFNFSEEETRFLQQAARGQNSNYSECLLATSEHGRRRLEIYAGPYERHILDKDLDPYGFIRQQGHTIENDDETTQSKLGDVISTKPNANNPLSKPPTAGAEPEMLYSQEDGGKIDDPSDLTAQTYPKNPEEEQTGKKVEYPGVDDPFEVQGGQDISRTGPPEHNRQAEEQEPKIGQKVEQQPDGPATTEPDVTNSTENSDLETTNPTTGEDVDTSTSVDEDQSKVDLVQSKLTTILELIQSRLPIGGSDKEDYAPHEPESSTAAEDSGKESADRNYPSSFEQEQESESRLKGILENETAQWLLKTLPIVIVMLLIGTGLIFFLT